MCLAKVYLGSAEGHSGADTGVEMLMENVTRVEVNGDRIRVVSLLGEKKELRGGITSIDFSEGRLVLEGAEL